MRKFSIVICILFACITSCSNHISDMNRIDTTPVKGFELEKYLGTWYEIARFPHSFEKNLTGVTATYSLKNDGKVKVVNAGYRNTLNGKYQKAVGKAKFAGEKNVGHLKVSFFLFFYGDYYIMELDKEHYQWALVGGSNANYLWILAREPVLDEQTYENLINSAKKRGYDLSELERVPQKSRQ